MRTDASRRRERGRRFAWWIVGLVGAISMLLALLAQPFWVLSLPLPFLVCFPLFDGLSRRWLSKPLRMPSRGGGLPRSARGGARQDLMLFVPYVLLAFVLWLMLGDAYNWALGVDVAPGLASVSSVWQ